MSKAAVTIPASLVHPATPGPQSPLRPPLCRLRRLLRLYEIGDRIGAVAEGGAGGSVTFSNALKGLKAFPRGTDETDTARLFLRYVNTVGLEQFSVTGWYSYHTLHRAATRYGRTWRDHFSTVMALQAKGKLDYDQLVILSADRRSLGNGCLALALPVALLFADRGEEIADRITTGTHHLGCSSVQLAVRYIQGEITLDRVMAQALPDDWVFSWGLTPLAPACLWAAASLAHMSTVREIIQAALDAGGDVDSYLSLALVFWQIRRERELISVRR